jgi:hypothetical protein
MGGIGKKPTKDTKDKEGSKKSPPPTIDEDDEEDGDFATPKRDRTGDDDRPL